MDERQGLERQKRRARIYSGRIKRTLTRGGLKHNCLFLHLPKCGGTSLSEALYATVPIHKRIGVLDAVSTRRAASILKYDEDSLTKTHEDMEGAAATFALREKMMLAYMCEDKTLIHGHVLFSPIMWKYFGETYRIVTVMRDPVKRALSNFRMNVATGVLPPDPDQWLDGIQGLNHACVNLRYLSGVADIPRGQEATLLPQAHDALDRLSLVGFLDEMDVFLDRFAAQFGPRPRLYRYNRAAEDVQITLNKQQTARLEQLCAPDIELYKTAYKKWGNAT